MTNMDSDATVGRESDTRIRTTTRTVCLTGLTPIMFDRYPGDNSTKLEWHQKVYLPHGSDVISLPSINIISFLSSHNTNSAPKRLRDKRKYKDIANACLSFVCPGPVEPADGDMVPFLRDGKPVRMGIPDAERDAKSGFKRILPPFPVSTGYLGEPTVVKNVETLCKAALIAVNGGIWFAGLGTKQSTGTKLLSISGDVERPGIYDYPFGVSVAQVLNDCGAGHAQAVQVSGPSGSCLATHEFSRRIAFEDVPTAGAFMVFGSHRDMFEVARNFAHFFAHESCGFCTPCRVGTALVANCMDKSANSHGSHYDINEIFKIHSLWHATS